MKKARHVWFVVVAMFLLVVFSSSSFAQTPYENRINKNDSPKDSLVLVSWNACNFGKSKSPETLAFMAKLLRDADIVAIQEVSTMDVGAFTVARLADELNRTGSKWDYVVSDPTVGPGTERFAFLFKTSRVWINRDDNKLASSLKDSLDREPAIMIFHSGSKKFSVASFHLQPDNKREGKDPRNEVAAIGSNPGDFMNGAIVMVGDFNLGHTALKTFSDCIGTS
jgi:endonuclease/exonuclease/phosphatase family metal-dependent hydrolase